VDEFSTHLLELLQPLGSVSLRRMFSGAGVFYGATMFGLVIRDELFFKVGEGNRADYESAGQAPFTYSTKNGVNTIGSLWSCPPELLDDPDEFRTWARKAVDAALAAARAKPRRAAAARPKAPRRRRVKSG
jgi:DNA transformation protein